MSEPKTPLEALKAIVAGGPYTDEFGVDEVTLLPPMDSVELFCGQNDAGLSWPSEIKELLKYARGIRVGLFEIEFKPTPSNEEFSEDVLGFEIGYVHLFGNDSGGGLWFVEVDRRSGEWGAVWYICWDPGVNRIQSPSLTAFLLDVKADLNRADPSPICCTSDERTYEIYKHGGDLMTIEEAMQDRTLAPLLKGVDPVIRVCDLRAAERGTGFRSPGGKRQAKRLGKERVFLVPPMPPSMLTKLRRFFGKDKPAG